MEGRPVLRTVLLVVHVAAGVSGLVLGPPVLWFLARRARARGSRRLEATYLLAVGAVCLTALGLVLTDLGAYWWLGPVAVLTGGAAYGAHRLRGGIGPAARAWHVRLLGGTYIALVTALLVVSLGGWISWLLPGVAGAAAIEYLIAVQRRLPTADAAKRETWHAV